MLPDRPYQNLLAQNNHAYLAPIFRLILWYQIDLVGLGNFSVLPGIPHASEVSCGSSRLALLTLINCALSLGLNWNKRIYGEYTDTCKTY